MRIELQRRVAGCCAIAFVALTIVVWRHPVIGGDVRVDQRILTVPLSVGWHLAVFVSFFASGPVVAVVGLLCAAWTIWRLRRPAGAIAIVLAPALAGAIEVAMKSIVSRARPLTAALSGESGNGYPSGHVTGFAAMTVAVLVVWVLQREDRTRDRAVCRQPRRRSRHCRRCLVSSRARRALRDRRRRWCPPRRRDRAHLPVGVRSAVGSLAWRVTHCCLSVGFSV